MVGKGPMGIKMGEIPDHEEISVRKALQWSNVGPSRPPKAGLHMQLVGESCPLNQNADPQPIQSGSDPVILLVIAGSFSGSRKGL